MNSLVKRSFSMNLTMFPRNNPSKLYLIYGYIFLFSSLLLDPIFGTLYYLRNEELTLMDAGLDLVLIFAMVGYIPKMLPFIANGKKINECIYDLDISFNVTLNNKQKNIIEDCIWGCWRNFRLFIVCGIGDNLPWTLRPFFLPQREFPMDVWVPFDPETHRVMFYCVYFFVVIGAIYTVLTNISVDTLISGLVFHAAGQIKILKDNLEFLLDYAEMKIPQVSDEVIFQKIRECSQHHQHIISFVKKIEDCFSWVVFSQFFGSIVIICLCCFLPSQAEPGSVNFLLASFYLISALTQIYLYCYYGTALYEESNTLATAAYLGRWYEYDIKSQKALLIFMERAKVPTTVTAGKLLDLSLSTFTEVLKKSYSLLAVLENH